MKLKKPGDIFAALKFHYTFSQNLVKGHKIFPLTFSQLLSKNKPSFKKKEDNLLFSDEIR